MTRDERIKLGMKKVLQIIENIIYKELEKDNSSISTSSDIPSKRYITLDNGTRLELF